LSQLLSFHAEQNRVAGLHALLPWQCKLPAVKQRFYCGANKVGALLCVIKFNSDLMHSTEGVVIQQKAKELLRAAAWLSLTIITTALTVTTM